MDESPRRWVRARLDPALIAQADRALDGRVPTDRITREAHGWSIRDEVPWFLLFFAVALGALALLAHIGTIRAPGYPRGLRSLPWVLDIAWLLSASRFARALYGSWSITLAPGALTVLRRWGARVRSELRVDPEDICSVRVCPDGEVRIEGPRQTSLGPAFRAGWLDPPALPRWVAEAVATLAERAQSRPDDEAR
jgi:hypothetical protein